MDIYTVAVLMTLFILLITVMDVKTNRLVDKKNKSEIITVCVFIFIAGVCEYIGKKINGAPAGLIGLHRAVKVIEFCAAPCIGVAAAKAYGKLKREKLIAGMLTVHTVFEITAAINGWVFSVDSSNLYHREKFYWVYITVFLCSIICCYVCIVQENRKYQARLGIVNALILLFLSVGIGIQMIYSEITVDFMCVSMGSFFLYHYRGNVVNQVDVTTRLLNRRCYERSMDNAKAPAYVLIFDVNNFKTINDTFGHAEGDECLRKVANKIFAVYNKYGFCYRIGGDEFCVIMYRNLDRIDNLNIKFTNSIDKLCGKYGSIFGVSIGYAYYDGKNTDIDTAIKNADEMMYNNKKRKVGVCR